MYTHQMSFITKTPTTGYQYASDLFHLGNIKDQLLTATDAGGLTGSDYNSNKWTVNAFDMNPAQRASGGGITTTSLLPRQDKCLWKSVKGEHQIMNGQNVTTSFTLYYCTPKVAYEGVSANFLSSPSFSGPIMEVWGRAGADIQNNVISAFDNPIQRVGLLAPTSGIPVGVGYGTTPFRQRLVRNSFKVLKAETHSLQPGSTKKIKFHFHMNKILDRQRLQECIKDNTVGGMSRLFLPNKSILVFIVARSVPVNVNINTEQDRVEACAPGPVNLLHTVNYTNYFSYIPHQEKLYNEILDYNYSNVSNAEALGAARIVDDTDEIHPVTQLG
jgi:hypothetical protein